MKIHGTAKGGALSTKDFGVAFGGNGVTPGAELIWEQLSIGQDEALWSGGVRRAGEVFLAEHVTIGAVPVKFIFNLKKTTNEGTPSGTAPLNLIDSADAPKATFLYEETESALDMDDLTESFASYTFVNDGNTETIDAGDRVVFTYTNQKYFKIELCASCAETGTKMTNYTTILGWSNHATRVCTMQIYGTPA